MTASRERTDTVHEKTGGRRRSSGDTQRAAMVFAGMMSVLMAGELNGQNPAENTPIRKNDERKEKPLTLEKCEELDNLLNRDYHPTRQKAADDLMKGITFDGILHLSMMPPAKSLEGKRRREETMERAFPREVLRQFPLPADLDQHWFYLNGSLQHSFMRLIPEQEHRWFHQLFEDYKQQAKAAKKKSGKENDWEDEKWMLDQYIRRKYERDTWQAFQWTQDDESKLQEWLANNPRGNAVAWRKNRITERIACAAKKANDAAEMMINASERWRESNKLQRLRKDPPRPLSQSYPAPNEGRYWNSAPGLKMRELLATGEDAAYKIRNMMHTHEAKLILKK